MTGHRIEIEAVPAVGPTRYRVTFDGKTLIERARDPEHEACRALKALGLTGMLTTHWRGSDVPAMRLDIEAGALRTVTEGDRGLAVVKWKPFDPEARKQKADCCPTGASQTGELDAAGRVLAET